MKTSNYILIALFSFIIGSILVLFIAAIGHENNPYGAESGSEKREYSLEDFSVIVTESNVFFHSSENNSLAFFLLPEDHEKVKNSFRVSNDTLFIFPIAGIEHINLNVYGNRLSAVIAKNNSRVSINRFNSETLSVDVQHATFTLDNSDIRELNVLGDKANIRVYSNKVESLSAQLKNESSLDISRNANKVDIEKDETSRYSFYQ